MDTSERTQWDALVVHPGDDVAIALRDVAAGEAIDVRRDGRIERIGVTHNVALGHKFALRAIPVGSAIRKYGEAIGIATADIAAGAHVHVHNLASRRGRTA